jgi:hypothetical protein
MFQKPALNSWHANIYPAPGFFLSSTLTHFKQHIPFYPGTMQQKLAYGEKHP